MSGMSSCRSSTYVQAEVISVGSQQLAKSCTTAIGAIKASHLQNSSALDCGFIYALPLFTCTSNMM